MAPSPTLVRSTRPFRLGSLSAAFVRNRSRPVSFRRSSPRKDHPASVRAGVLVFAVLPMTPPADSKPSRSLVRLLARSCSVSSEEGSGASRRREERRVGIGISQGVDPSELRGGQPPPPSRGGSDGCAEAVGARWIDAKALPELEVRCRTDAGGRSAVQHPPEGDVLRLHVVTVAIAMMMIERDLVQGRIGEDPSGIVRGTGPLSQMPVGEGPDPSAFTVGAGGWHRSHPDVELDVVHLRFVPQLRGRQEAL
mmetsp:Transcript_18637/g.43097  ORF Transcript_18637/g.43097 Transcript_18637/m.43097 type:complete len:252 (+) Transcript_18637:378-1133(+)